ncbi:alpha/beta fold hydrolase [Halarcobacter anaerophilus]|uniref:2-hydroxy-6-oxo-2,4-heptadienoate hydrolase n=1 Tax=Halarcobacter anaerophilus TaxID=877500 RepID=A0A4Q0XWF4_9BACT|nr:alpha/beta hydrolase [Halarcobacter anaerophilus]QDF28747.1 2-hydroxy-6-oxo-6-phenylhexa-2,4-dienoate hydrolase [Halarcobacter anaerophilus]RXJ61886.1 2-hydroxy-6-oxo-2,4-heptadienoate hydrolase [Halarcobacter anaerophilus]
MENPEIAKSVKTGSFNTNYHDIGSGEPVIFIHGSGPGVSAYANWRLCMPEIAEKFRVIAPDMVGFGYSDRPEGITYSMEVWVQQIVDLMDSLNLEKVNLVGNSFGGALALSLVIKYPEKFNRVVLMGSVGVPFDITYGLDKVWGYTPSFENMKELLDIFAYSRELVTDDLAKMRYEASIRPGFQESFSSMFPSPRQNGVDLMQSDENDIKNIQKEVLIIHGREDKVIPLENSIKLNQLILKSQLHVFGQCGHWTQIEHKDRFNKLLLDFFSEED